MKIITIVGARPQFIKAAPVGKALAKIQDVEEILLHTGQHYDKGMSDIFFEELGIRTPDYNLGIGGGTHGKMTGTQLIGIEKILIKEQPDLVLVYGDTNSTLAGALAASKLNITIAHVEAGLRSFNRRMPEEINRIATDHICSILFAPTEGAMNHLSTEGIRSESCHLVGDVMLDATQMFSQVAESRSTILARLGLNKRSYFLATIHRQENTDDEARLTAIINGFAEISETMPIIWPMHPRTRKAIELFGLAQVIPKSVKILDPVGYLDMIMLESSATVIITDSGGVQKEAFFLNVPCVTLREETEWTELVDSGWNHLVPTLSARTISATAIAAIETEGKKVAPYGDGTASKRIANIISKKGTKQ